MLVLIDFLIYKMCMLLPVLSCIWVISGLLVLLFWQPSNRNNYHTNMQKKLTKINIITRKKSIRKRIRMTLHDAAVIHEANDLEGFYVRNNLRGSLWCKWSLSFMFFIFKFIGTLKPSIILQWVSCEEHYLIFFHQLCLRKVR